MPPLSLEILALGMCLTVVTFLQFPTLGADNFILTKLLVLTVFGPAAAVFRLTETRDHPGERADVLLLFILLLAVLSSTQAVNSWYAIAATGSLLASVLLFWVSRSLAASGFRETLLLVVVGAVGIVLATALLEAYTGLQLSTRQPGGTVGNRNRMAHLLVMGLPTLALLTARVRGRWGLMALMSTWGIVGMALALSRTRAAWVALGALLFVAMLLTACRMLLRKPLPAPSTQRRLAGSFILLCLGGGVAAVAPNSLNWTSATPYRDSISSLLDHRSGSGAGRLVEYANTVGMIRDHPMLGVGPGNWRVHYPYYATENDPTLGIGHEPVRRYGMSEWVSAAAERGLLSFLLLVWFGGVLLIHWARQIAVESSPVVSYAFAGVTTLTAIVLIGVLDPVVQTPIGGFVVPILVGAYAPTLRMTRPRSLPGIVRRSLMAGLVLVGLFTSSFRIREVWAAWTYASHLTADALERAAKIAPGDFRVRILSAMVLVETGDCEAALPHLAVAREVYPTAAIVRDLRGRCEDLPESPPLERDVGPVSVDDIGGVIGLAGLVGGTVVSGGEPSATPHKLWYIGGECSKMV
ncbi:MAG: O-antigen ligase family protein, partial [Gemmatimonadota bacterium]